METQIDFAELAGRAGLSLDDERVGDLIKVVAAECMLLCTQREAKGDADGEFRVARSAMAESIATGFACNPEGMLGTDQDNWRTRAVALKSALDPRLTVEDCEALVTLEWQAELCAGLQALDPRLSTADCEGIGQQLLNSLTIEPREVAGNWFVRYGNAPPT